MSRKKACVLLLLLGVVGLGGVGCVVGFGPVFPMGPGPYPRYGRPLPGPLPGPRVVIIP